MENINDYKRRFYTLMESTLGNVSPLLSEDADMADAQSIMGEEGITNDDVNTFCKATTTPPMIQRLMDRIPENMKDQAITTIKTFIEKIKNLSVRELIGLRREIKQQKAKAESQSVNEQLAATVTILGMAISTTLLIVIGAILLFILIYVIVSKASGKGRGSCNPGWWDNLNN